MNENSAVAQRELIKVIKQKDLKRRPKVRFPVDVMCHLYFELEIEYD